MFIVIDMESETPNLLGTFVAVDEDTICYFDTDGRYHHAPQDCVKVVEINV